MTAKSILLAADLNGSLKSPTPRFNRNKKTTTTRTVRV